MMNSWWTKQDTNPNNLRKLKGLEFESDLTSIALFRQPFPVIPFVVTTLPLPAAALRLPILNTLRPVTCRFRRAVAMRRGLIHVQLLVVVVWLMRRRKQRVVRRRRRGSVEVLARSTVVWRWHMGMWGRVRTVESSRCASMGRIFRWDPYPS